MLCNQMGVQVDGVKSVSNFNNMRVHDQTGQVLDIEGIPRRIVSVVPSQTELLYDLGLDHEVVGITKFCVHPQSWFRNKTRVGGTKKLDIGKIRLLEPDLLIANKEENTREDIDLIREFCPVWTSNISNVEQALNMISNLSTILGKKEAGIFMQDEIRKSISAIRPIGKKAVYLIWKKPYMTVGGDTFISSMMKLAGLENVFEGRRRYPELSLSDLAQSGADIILLSSEPYPFKMKDIEELHEILPEVKLSLVDGEMFSWYGSRMRNFASYISTFQH
jgi:ABC-type Fe3+-hydroxamate transport system substrate-binding protein